MALCVHCIHQKLWNEKHEDGAKKLADIITELKGFYVKTGTVLFVRLISDAGM
jgi:hypothetical protein